MTIKEIVERINYFRNLQNLSARELSLRIGKHSGYINKLESKDFNLPVEVLLQIIDELNISVDDFFGLGNKYNKETKQLIDKFNKLNNNNKQTILDLVDKLS